MSEHVNLRMTPAADPSQPGPGGRRHRAGDLYHEQTNFQFIDRSWRWALLSGAMVVVSLLSLVLGGLNLGIDFEGGTQWQFTVEGRSADAADVRDVLAAEGQPNVKVLILGSSGVRVQTEELGPREREAITDALAEYGGIDTDRISVTNVGPTWGDRVSRKALQALVIFFIAIALYLSVRFEARMAFAAIVAVIHDIIITAGVYALTGFEVTPATVVAVLTILGFSLYDTVVVFDKVKENEATLAGARGETYSMMVNRSLNQVLIRSLNTSFVALLPVVSLLVVGRFGLGAVGLQDFALALFVGLITGAYSSIFVATPIVAALKEREPKYRSVRERIAVQRSRDERGVTPAAGGPTAVGAPKAAKADPRPIVGPETATAVAVADADDEPDLVDEGPTPATPTVDPAPAPDAPSGAPTRPAPAATQPGGVTPRPRKQKRKRR